MLIEFIEYCYESCIILHAKEKKLWDRASENVFEHSDIDDDSSNAQCTNDEFGIVQLCQNDSLLLHCFRLVDILLH